MISSGVAMSKLYLEYGYSSLNKKNEELCGDRVEYRHNGEYTTLVLSDGLGSGVKANILATLTSKILCCLVSNDIEMQECIETIVQTLPVCKVRNVAYSTFSVVHVNKEGKGFLFEFDNPEAIFYHNGEFIDFEREEHIYCGKKIYVSNLSLEEGDTIFLMSDGVIHAGVGQILNLGWERNEIKKFLQGSIKDNMSARCMANILCGACHDLYVGEPGDDTTVACVKIRKKLPVQLMIGPPIDSQNDDFWVGKFMELDGKKIVCGGTTSHIVADYLNKEVVASCEFIDNDVPPTATIEGIDIVTEGVLTLRKLLELSERYLSISDMSPKYYTAKDGASLLADMLFEKATHIVFFVGQSINPAHQGLPIDSTMKMKLVENLTKNLREMGKQIEIIYD